MNCENYPSRPVEDYVIARVTIEERLARLTKHQRMAVVWKACGFELQNLSEIKGTTKNAQAKSYQQGMEKVKSETYIEKRPGRQRGMPGKWANAVCECGALPVVSGLCQRCLNRRKHLRRKAKKATLKTTCELNHLPILEAQQQ